jgi:hypothetical protein
MGWPKNVEIMSGMGVIKVPVDSWAELKEAMAEFGIAVLGVTSEDATLRPDPNSIGSTGAASLGHGDRTLLTQFVEAADRGLLTNQLSQALGKKGKGVRPALEKWSRRIALVTQENTTAFEPVKRFDGRGFRMLDHYRRTAASMLGRKP